MTAGWMMILMGLLLCRWLGRKNRRLRQELEADFHWDEERQGRREAGREKRPLPQEQNRAPVLATTGDFLYNRNNGGRVIPFPRDHRGGA